MADDSDHPVPTDDPEARARALQSLLVEKEKLSTDAVDEVVSTYEEAVGPMNGAEVVARAWSDPDYREWLLEDGTAAINDLGYTGVQGVDLEVCENTPETHNVIVCTLCSCYPWPVLGSRRRGTSPHRTVRRSSSDLAGRSAKSSPSRCRTASR